MKTLIVLMLGLGFAFGGQPLAAQSLEDEGTRSSSAEPLVPPPAKSKAIQFFGSAMCEGPDDGMADCDIDFPKIVKRKFALIDNITCLLKGERADVRWAQVHAMTSDGSIDTVLSAQNLKMRNTGAAGAGEIRFYSSSDATTFYLDGGQFARIRARIQFVQSPPATLECSISGRHL